YVLRQFVGAAVSCTLLILGLYLALDAFLRLEDFLKLEGRSAVIFFFEYYAYHLPGFLLLLAPFIGLAASMMTVIRLVRTNEITAMIGSGVSTLRILRPVCLSVIAMGVLMGAGEEWLLPGLSRGLREAERTLNAGRVSHEKLLADARDNKFVIGRYDATAAAIRGITVTHLTKAFRPDWQARAATARWVERMPVPAEQGGGERTGWLLSDGLQTRYDEQGKRLSQSRFGADGVLILSTLTPGDIEKVKDPLAHIPFADLVEFARSDPYNASLRVRIHLRITYPLYCLVLFGLGVPLVLRREVRGALMGVGVCILVSALFFLVHFTMVDLGNLNVVDPLLAAWLPVVAFGTVGILLFDSIQT
ncbi:MAG: LptF/LptG family permease, partial [Planctomycetes bacterium]|nr:LptF/LptG family permease [Planctomycetota bacterium]